MAQWVTLILGGLGLVGVGLGLTIWLGSVRWDDKTSQFVDRLIQTSHDEGQRRVTFKDFEQLPAPVARYFRWALKEGQPII